MAHIEREHATAVKHFTAAYDGSKYNIAVTKEQAMLVLVQFLAKKGQEQRLPRATPKFSVGQT